MTINARALASSRLAGARRLLESAVDHWERSNEPGATPHQRRTRRDQAASDVGAAIGQLSLAGYWMAHAALYPETDGS